MILLAGGVLKSYQAPIHVILEGISGRVFDLDDLSKNLQVAAEYKSSGILAFSTSEEPWEAFEALIAEAEETLNVLAFYLPAKLGLAHFLAAGLKPDEAAFAWITTTKSVLSFERKYRENVFLANADVAIRFPEEFVEVCVTKYRFSGADSIHNLPGTVAPDDIHGILANQTIRQNKEVLKLQQELEARKRLISPFSVPDVFDLKSAFEDMSVSSQSIEEVKVELNSLAIQEIKASRDLAVIQKEFRELSEVNRKLEMKNEMSIEQLAIIPEKLTQNQNDSDIEILLKENNQLKSDLSTLWTKYEAASAAARRSTEKDGLMVQQMGTVQAEVHQTYESYAKVLTELEELKKIAKWKEGKAERLVTELENDLARTHKRIDNLQSSFSWKLTRPVRIISRAIGLANRRVSKTDLERVSASGFFNESWYLKTYPDLANIAMSALEHFVKYGAFEGRSPGPNFNTRKYTKDNPNVLIEGTNPLLHYLEAQNVS